MRDKNQKAIVPNPPAEMPLELVLNKFYREHAGLHSSNIITYPLLNNTIQFSNDTAQNYYAMANFSDRAFGLKNIIPDENKKFSELYCEIVLSLNYRDNDDNKSKIHNLTEKIKKLESQLKDSSVSSIEKEIYQRDKEKLEEQLGVLITSHTKSLVEDAQKYCNNNDMKARESNNLFMKVKNQDLEQYVSKIEFGININNILSCTIDDTSKNTSKDSSEVGFLDKVKDHWDKFTNSIRKWWQDLDKAPEDTTQVEEQPDYFQSYTVDFLDKNGIPKTGKAEVSFDSIIKISIEFPWLNSEIYKVSQNKHVVLNVSQNHAAVYAKFCRIPKKIIIGTRPIIKYEITDGTNNEKSPIEPYTIPENLAVVIGYELDSSLCDSPLLGAFQAYDDTN